MFLLFRETFPSWSSTTCMTCSLLEANSRDWDGWWWVRRAKTKAQAELPPRPTVRRRSIGWELREKKGASLAGCRRAAGISILFQLAHSVATSSAFYFETCCPQALCCRLNLAENSANAKFAFRNSLRTTGSDRPLRKRPSSQSPFHTRSPCAFP